ncbi:hypothetical protein DN069_08605 [Streptacidiphilus pinicola]|uniref:N-acetyltransferase domain-containing protein n=1 Tax=Streptacidiphilus pinicola TaxID=2219663 RepID=A0A2X0IR70_9ACTN|nr:GNAT family N-acetyltransferase [Streptacidiphilus pinicola]RAG86063.1 hypothetical protein DN069_08605 [Streptacidiphilus pinicola]
MSGQGSARTGALRGARSRLTGSLDAGAMFAATVDEEILGVGSVTPQPHWSGGRDAYGLELVAPHAARRGIGRALVETARASTLPSASPRRRCGTPCRSGTGEPFRGPHREHD